MITLKQIMADPRWNTLDAAGRIKLVNKYYNDYVIKDERYKALNEQQRQKLYNNTLGMAGLQAAQPADNKFQRLTDTSRTIDVATYKPPAATLIVDKVEQRARQDRAIYEANQTFAMLDNVKRKLRNLQAAGIAPDKPAYQQATQERVALEERVQYGNQTDPYLRDAFREGERVRELAALEESMQDTQQRLAAAKDKPTRDMLNMRVEHEKALKDLYTTGYSRGYRNTRDWAKGVSEWGMVPRWILATGAGFAKAVVSLGETLSITQPATWAAPKLVGGAYDKAQTALEAILDGVQDKKGDTSMISDVGATIFASSGYTLLALVTGGAGASASFGALSASIATENIRDSIKEYGSAQAVPNAVYWTNAAKSLVEGGVEYLSDAFQIKTIKGIIGKGAKSAAKSEISKSLLRRLADRGFKTFAQDLGKTAISEGLEEGVQGMSNYIFDVLTGQREPATAPQLLAEMGQAMLYGALGGLTFGIIGGGIQRSYNSYSFRQLKKAAREGDATAKTLLETRDLMVAGKVKEAGERLTTLSKELVTNGKPMNEYVKLELGRQMDALAMVGEKKNPVIEAIKEVAAERKAEGEAKVQSVQEEAERILSGQDQVEPEKAEEEQAVDESPAAAVPSTFEQTGKDQQEYSLSQAADELKEQKQKEIERAQKITQEEMDLADTEEEMRLIQNQGIEAIKAIEESPKPLTYEEAIAKQYAETMGEDEDVVQPEKPKPTVPEKPKPEVKPEIPAKPVEPAKPDTPKPVEPVKPEAPVKPEPTPQPEQDFPGAIDVETEENMRQDNVKEWFKPTHTSTEYDKPVMVVNRRGSRFYTVYFDGGTHIRYQKDRTDLAKLLIPLKKKDTKPATKQDEGKKPERITTPAKRVPEGFRELNPEEMGGAFTSQLKKGDTFTIGDKTYTVTADGKKVLRIRSNTGKSYSINKYYTKDGKVGSYYGGDSKGDQVENFFRDVEGIIALDLVNENNPFHELSFVTKAAIAGYEEQLAEKPDEDKKPEEPAKPDKKPEPRVYETKGYVLTAKMKPETKAEKVKAALDELKQAKADGYTRVKIGTGAYAFIDDLDKSIAAHEKTYAEYQQMAVDAAKKKAEYEKTKAEAEAKKKDAEPEGEGLYFISRRDGKETIKVEVDGSPIKIESPENIDFFIFKPSETEARSYGGKYVIAETRTGYLFAVGDTRQKAVEKAKKRLLWIRNFNDNHNLLVDEYNKIIDDSSQKYPQTQAPTKTERISALEGFLESYKKAAEDARERDTRSAKLYMSARKNPGELAQEMSYQSLVDKIDELKASSQKAEPNPEKPAAPVETATTTTYSEADYGKPHKPKSVKRMPRTNTGLYVRDKDGNITNGAIIVIGLRDPALESKYVQDRTDLSFAQILDKASKEKQVPIEQSAMTLPDTLGGSPTIGLKEIESDIVHQFNANFYNYVTANTDYDNMVVTLNDKGAALIFTKNGAPVAMIAGYIADKPMTFPQIIKNRNEEIQRARAALANYESMSVEEFNEYKVTNAEDIALINAHDLVDNGALTERGKLLLHGARKGEKQGVVEKFLAKFLPKKPSTPSFAYARKQGKYITAVNYDGTGVSVYLESDLPDGYYESAGGLIVPANLTKDAGDMVPLLPDPESTIKKMRKIGNIDGILPSIMEAIKFASTDIYRPVLNAVNIAYKDGIVTVASTNGRYVYNRTFKANYGADPFSVTIATDALAMIRRLNPKNVEMYTRQGEKNVPDAIMLKMDGGYVQSAAVDSVYPDWEKAYNTGSDLTYNKIEYDAKAAIAAINDLLDGVDRSDTMGVTFVYEDGKITFSKGDKSITIPAKLSHEGLYHKGNIDLQMPLRAKTGSDVSNSGHLNGKYLSQLLATAKGGKAIMYALPWDRQYQDPFLFDNVQDKDNLDPATAWGIYEAEEAKKREESKKAEIPSTTPQGAPIRDNRKIAKAFLSVIPRRLMRKLVKTDTGYMVFLKNGKVLKINIQDGAIYEGDKAVAGRIEFKRAGDIAAIVDIARNYNNENDTSYHEGFHMAFNMFLAADEQAVLVEEYGNEEAAAIAFAKYAIAKKKGGAKQAIADVFKKLWLRIQNFISRAENNGGIDSAALLMERVRLAEYAPKLSKEAVSLADEMVRDKNIPAPSEIAEAEAQMDAVRAKYQGTDQWMKAPNGKPTNLNERQWLQVRTENFKKWFGDWEKDPENASKIVDKNGEPLVVYHGTNSKEFYEFANKGSAHDAGFYGRGYYFVYDPNGYNTAIGEASYYGKRIIPAFLNSKNPFVFDDLISFNGTNVGALISEGPAFLYNIAKRFPELESQFKLPDRYIYNAQTGKNEPVPISYNEYVELVESIPKKLNIYKVSDQNKEITHWVDYTYTRDYIDKDGNRQTVEETSTISRNISLEKDMNSIIADDVFIALDKHGFDARYQPEGYMTRHPEVSAAIKAHGHDGVLQTLDGDEAVVFNPNQIKSATENVGTFDAENPDIRYKTIPTTREIAEAEAQMEAVRKQYQGTDQWMKAPNGKPTNLNERQWLQVRTPNFLRWFGNWIDDPKNASKVVDENGEPMVVYHGTPETFTEFDKNMLGQTGTAASKKGFWFSKSSEVASFFVQYEQGGIYPVFINLKNPVTTNDKGLTRLELISGVGHNKRRDVLQKAIRNKKDGAIFYNTVDFGGDRTDTYAVFDPTQIKSATANVGTFNADNPDIRYKLVNTTETNAGDSETYTVLKGYKPKRTIKAYKVGRMDADGNIRPMFVDAKADPFPLNEYIKANEAYHFTAKNGLMYVPALTGSNITLHQEAAVELAEMGYIKSPATKSITAVSYRPGWHASALPFAPQMGPQPRGITTEAHPYKNVYPSDTVFMEVEIDMSTDYTDEAKQRSNGLQSLPNNGGYRFTTSKENDKYNDVNPWYISSAMKIIRVLSRDEVNAMLREKGIPVKMWADEVGKTDPENADIRYKQIVDAVNDTTLENIDEREADKKQPATLVRDQAVMNRNLDMYIKRINAIDPKDKEALKLMLKEIQAYLKAVLPKVLTIDKRTIMAIANNALNKTTRARAIKFMQSVQTVLDTNAKKKGIAEIKKLVKDNIQKAPNRDVQRKIKISWGYNELLQYIQSVMKMTKDEVTAELTRLQKEQEENDKIDDDVVTVEERERIALGEKIIDDKAGILMMYSGMNKKSAQEVAVALANVYNIIKEGRSIMESINAEEQARHDKTNRMLGLYIGLVNRLSTSGVPIPKKLLGTTEAQKRMRMARSMAYRVAHNIGKGTGGLHYAQAFMETLFADLDRRGYKTEQYLNDLLESYEMYLETDPGENIPENLEDEEYAKALSDEIDLRKAIEGDMEVLREMLDFMKVYPGDYNGWFTQTFFKPITQANRLAYIAEKAKHTMIDAMRAEIYRAVTGKDKAGFGEWATFMRKLHTTTIDISVVDRDTGKRVNTPFKIGVLMTVYAHMQREEMIKTLDNTGFDEKARKQVADFMESGTLGKYAKEWVMWVTNQLFPVLYDDYNASYMLRFGVPMSKVEVYTPIIRDIEFTPTEKEVGSTIYTYTPLQIMSRNMIERLKSNRKLDIDKSNFDTLLLDYVHGMEHFKYYSPLFMDAKKTILRRDNKLLIKKVMGKQFLDSLVQYYSAIAMDKRAMYTKSEFWEKAYSRFMFSVMMGKIILGVKQVGSFPLFLTAVKGANPVRFVEGMVWSLTHPLRVGKLIADSPLLQKRYSQGFDIETFRVLHKAYSNYDLAKLNAWLMKWASPTKHGDMLAVAFGGGAMYHANYKYYLKQGMNHDQAHHQAVIDLENTTIRTQQSSEIYAVSHIQAGQYGGLFGRLLTSFQSAPIAYYNLIYNWVQNAKIGKKPPLEKLFQALAMFMFTSILYSFLESGFETPDSPDDVLYNVAHYNIGNCVVLGQIAQEIAEMLRTKKAPYNTSFMAFEEFFTAIYGTAKYTLNLLDDYDDKDLDKLAQEVGTLTGIPYRATKAQVTGLIDTFSGENTDPAVAMGMSKRARKRFKRDIYKKRD